MPEPLKPYYIKEIGAADIAFKQGNWILSWSHLERAHILAQPYPWQHTRVHWKMLIFGIRTKNVKEIIGQIPRLLVGGVKSFVGKIPVGNTGGANVPPLKPMDIPEELLHIINQSNPSKNETAI